MTSFLDGIRSTVVPGRDSKHGPLPPLLLSMTLVTGLVDAFSYLLLGHVFVANMTGNVVILGFALVGATGFSITSSLLAIGAFAVGALFGGRIGTRVQHRGRHLGATTALQAGLLAAGALLAGFGGQAPAGGYHYGLIALLALAMGMQNATVRKLAVPDLTTSVLTLTITGIAADSKLAGGKGAAEGRRVIAVAAMLSGAVVGGAFIVHLQVVEPLLIALAVMAAVAVVGRSLGKSQDAWTTVAS